MTKFQARSSRELLKALQKAAKCIASKNTISILSSVLLSESGHKYYFTSSTGDAQLTLPAPMVALEGNLSHPVAIPVELISSFLGTLPDCVIDLNFNDSRAIEMTYCTDVNGQLKEGKVVVSYEDGSMFPKLQSVSGDNVTHIVIPREKFDTTTSNMASFALRNDLHPVLGCMYIDVAEDMSDVTFVGSNGTMLYRYVHSNNPARGGSDFFRGGAPTGMLVSCMNFRVLSVFEDCENIDIESDGRTIRFSAKGIELLCKQVEGRYPNYKSVIPLNAPNYLTFSKKEMLNILKRISIFSSKTSNAIVLAKDGMFLDVSAQDADFSRSASDQVLLAGSECADGFQIGFSYVNLQTAINAINSDTVKMCITSPSRAVTFTADTPAPTELSLCMPMQIQ